MNEIDELREQLQQARQAYTEAQTNLHHLEWKMFQVHYDEYLARLRRYEVEQQGPYDQEQWFRVVRPLCRDCRLEVVTPYDEHSVSVAWGEPPELRCGRQYPW